MGETVGLNRRAVRTMVVFGLGALVVLGAAAGMRSALADAPPPTIECDVAATVYGEPISCEATGADVAGLSWSDGTIDTAALSSTRAPNAVGSIEIAAVDGDGSVLATTSVTVEPDIALDCAEGEEKIIFELAATELRDKGWDYVYIDRSTGERVLPGDAQHPNGGAEDGLERVELGRDISSGICKIVSAAAEDLDGSYEATLVTELEGAVVRQSHLIGPSSQTRWSGMQPGELTGTVTIGAVSASERRGVYVSGCN